MRRLIISIYLICIIYISIFYSNGRSTSIRVFFIETGKSLQWRLKILESRGSVGFLRKVSSESAVAN
jgi:hypothetical protein